MEEHKQATILIEAPITYPQQFPGKFFCLQAGEAIHPGIHLTIRHDGYVHPCEGTIKSSAYQEQSVLPMNPS